MAAKQIIIGKKKMEKKNERHILQSRVVCSKGKV